MHFENSVKFFLEDKKMVNMYLIFIAVLFLLLFTEKLIEKYQKKKQLNAGMDIIDIMAGKEFESFLTSLFSSLGYKCKLTKDSHDFGADIVLTKFGKKTVVQAKRCNNKIGILAVQEVVASLAHYGAYKGIVVTNNYFTKSAIELAKSNGIDLWDRDLLRIKLNRANHKEQAVEIIKKTNSDMVCPECNSPLVTRHSIHGEFIGCTKFPKCKFKRNL